MIDDSTNGAEVTIVILSCERPALFALALASAVAQTVPAAVLVSDDSSSDDVRRIVSDHPRPIAYLPGPQSGQLANLLNAFGRVQTRWTVVLHDDDLLAPTCVAELLAAVVGDGSPEMVISDYMRIDVAGNDIGISVFGDQRRRAIFRPGPNRLSFEERCDAFLVQGAVSPFLGSLLPSTLLGSWRPDARVDSILDLHLCETLARHVNTVSYVPNVLTSYRVHGVSTASRFDGLGSFLFIVDSQLADESLRSIWAGLRRRRSDMITRQARVWTAFGDWKGARELLLCHRRELTLRDLGPTAVLTLPGLRSLYRRRIRKSNPRMALPDA